jgi:hypothetical protein
MCLEKSEQLLLGHSDSDFQRHPSWTFSSISQFCYIGPYMRLEHIVLFFFLRNTDAAGYGQLAEWQS